jgi:asparagine synthase (glutamine-hydrolysing)
LSGEGADETLNGYVRYQPLRASRALGLGRLLLPHTRFLERGRLEIRARKLRKFLTLPTLDDFVLFNACDLLPGDLRQVGFEPRDEFSFRRDRLAEARRAYPTDRLRQAMYLDQHTFLCSLLDRNDRMTMGASIEFRVPFLDFRLVERLASFSTARLTRGFSRKSLLRSSMRDRLPESVQRHPKKGFGVPWTRYMKEVPVYRDLLARLHDVEPIASGPFDRMRVQDAVSRWGRGDGELEPLIRMLMLTAIWHEVRFREPLARTGTAP